MQNLQRTWVNTEGRQRCSRHVREEKHWELCRFRRQQIYNSNPGNCLPALFHLCAFLLVSLGGEASQPRRFWSRKLLWWSLGKENMQEPKKTQHTEKTREEENHKQKIHVQCIDLCLNACISSAVRYTHTHTERERERELVYSGESAICAIFSCSEIFVFPVTAEGGGRIYLHIHIWATRLPNRRPSPPPAARRAWKSALISRAGCWGTAQ